MKLKENENRYRLLFNGGDDPVLVNRLDKENGPGLFFEVNDSACNAFGYSRGEFLKLFPGDLFAPHEKNRVFRIARILLIKKTGLFQAELQTKTGRIFPAEIRCRFFNLDGRPAVFSILRDITDQKKDEYVQREIARKLTGLVKTRTSELLKSTIALEREIEEKKKTNEELRTSEQRVKALLNASDDGVFLIDSQNTLLALNQTMADRFGGKIEDLLGQNMSQLLPGNFFKSRKKIYEKVIVTKAPVRSQYAIDGRFFDNSVSPVLDASGEVVQIAAFSRDVTKKIQAQAALRESEQRYRSFVENFNGIAFQSAITSRTHFTPVFCHGAVTLITGYMEQEYIAKFENWETLIHPEDRRRFLDSRKQLATDPDTSLQIEYRIKTKNKKYIWLKELVKNICGNAGKPILIEGVIYDISERKQSEAAVGRLTRHLLERIEAERKKISRDLHDEFGQMLTTLRFNVEEVMGISLTNAKLSQIKPLSNKCRRVIQQIEALGDSIRRIINELRPDLLDHMGLASAISWQIDNYRRQHSNVNFEFKEIGLKKRFDNKIEIALYRIFQEGLNNIIKHAEARQIKISLIYSFPDVILRLEDDGIGFITNRVAVGDQQKGIGLLSMRERAGAIGGAVKIISEVGKGTVVRAEVPCVWKDDHE